MGTPLPPNEPGANCFVCWGAGKAFGDTTTPRIITVQLSDLQPGNFWDADDEQLLLTPHSLIQGPGPCGYSLLDARFSYALSYFPDRTIFSILRRFDNRATFYHEALPACLLSIPNQLINPLAVVAVYGTAFLTWNLGGL